MPCTGCGRSQSPIWSDPTPPKPRSISSRPPGASLPEGANVSGVVEPGRVTLGSSKQQRGSVAEEPDGERRWRGPAASDRLRAVRDRTRSSGAGRAAADRQRWSTAAGPAAANGGMLWVRGQLPTDRPRARAGAGSEAVQRSGAAKTRSGGAGRAAPARQRRLGSGRLPSTQRRHAVGSRAAADQPRARAGADSEAVQRRLGAAARAVRWPLSSEGRRRPVAAGPAGDRQRGMAVCLTAPQVFRYLVDPSTQTSRCALPWPESPAVRQATASTASRRADGIGVGRLGR